MNNVYKYISIIILIVAIGFTAVRCGGDEKSLIQQIIEFLIIRHINNNAGTVEVKCVDGNVIDGAPLYYFQLYAGSDGMAPLASSAQFYCDTVAVKHRYQGAPGTYTYYLWSEVESPPNQMLPGREIQLTAGHTQTILVR